MSTTERRYECWCYGPERCRVCSPWMWRANAVWLRLRYPNFRYPRTPSRTKD